MGTLSPPFILCPLSDRKQLQGMSEDKTVNKGIITIGRNIAIRYHLLEQKQETSWMISRHWLTSRVVYCPEVDKYGAVVDNSTVALWAEEDTNLRNFSKQKFSDPVFELRPTSFGKTLVVFENGFVVPLDKAFGDKKIASERRVIDTEKQVIIDVGLNYKGDTVVLVVAARGSNKKTERHVQTRKSLKTIICKLSNLEDSPRSLDITGVKAEVVGHCVICTSDDWYILYLCTDGRLFKRCLSPETSCKTPVFVGLLGKFVSTKTPVVMKFIEDGCCLVVYGSDVSEEGAVVLLYDINYDILVAKQSLKMYGNPPIMEKVGSSVLVPVGLHILVLGYRTSKSLLSTVVGKHQIRSGEEVFEQRNPLSIQNNLWDVDKDVPSKLVSKKKKRSYELEAIKAQDILIKETFPQFWEIVQQFKIFEREGQPESLIINQIIPMALEKRNTNALDWILDTFSDIPENFVVTILSCLLDGLEEPTLTTLDDQPKNKKKNISTVYTPNSLLNKLLVRKFDEHQLTLNLPSLSYDKVRLLICYLRSMIEQSWQSANLSVVLELNDSEGDLLCWIKWISSLLDAHYPKFVMNSEIELVDEILSVIEERSKVMNAIQELEPFLLLTASKVDFQSKPGARSKWRTEMITFV